MPLNECNTVCLWSELSSLFHILNPIIRAQWLFLNQDKKCSQRHRLSWSSLYPPCLDWSSCILQCSLSIIVVVSFSKLHSGVTHGKSRKPPQSSCLKRVKCVLFYCVVSLEDAHLKSRSYHTSIFHRRAAAECVHFGWGRFFCLLCIQVITSGVPRLWCGPVRGWCSHSADPGTCPRLSPAQTNKHSHHLTRKPHKDMLTKLWQLMYSAK